MLCRCRLQKKSQHAVSYRWRWSVLAAYLSGIMCQASQFTQVNGIACGIRIEVSPSARGKVPSGRSPNSLPSVTQSRTLSEQFIFLASLAQLNSCLSFRSRNHHICSFAPLNFRSWNQVLIATIFGQCYRDIAFQWQPGGVLPLSSRILQPVRF
jgi:hypothetical protein